MKKTASIIIALAIAVAGIAAVLFFDARHELSDAYRRWRMGPVPQTITRAEIKNSTDETVDWSTVPEEEEIAQTVATDTAAPAPDPETAFHPDVEENPAILNLFVPFMLQSPFAEWTDVDQEACEEASMLMLQGYLDDTASFSPEETREGIDAIVAYENERFGYFEDTTAAEVVSVLGDLLGIDATVVPITSIDDIKDRIADGDPVLIPAYGKALKNPYFRNDGPLYHMLIAKGYTSTHIIVNDPGTRRGEDFLYENDVLWNAIGDWNDGDPEHGDKVMIVAR